MSIVVKQTQCPKCAKLGNDTSKDNLAIYSDGHEYCFSCGYYTSPNKIKVFKESYKEITKYTVYLPEDSTTDYPHKALAWIEQYELTKNDLVAHNCVWSERKQRLIFPIYDSSGLLAYQGRYFGEDKAAPKWLGYGDLKKYLPYHW